MTPEAIELAGRLLFGPEWKWPFCDQFVINARYLRRLMAGTVEPAEGLTADIRQALQARKLEIHNLLETVR